MSTGGVAGSINSNVPQPSPIARVQVCGATLQPVRGIGAFHAPAPHGRNLRCVRNGLRTMASGYMGRRCISCTSICPPGVWK